MSEAKEHTGLFICSGCSIGKQLDPDRIKEKADSSGRYGFVEVEAQLCHPDCKKRLLGEIEKHGLNKVLLAACSPRHKSKELDFNGSVQTERVNLRELVVWSQEARAENSMDIAADYLDMGYVRLITKEKPEPYLTEKFSDSILVIGAGITGITAALEASAAGYPVDLVEKESEAGGFMRKMHRLYPHREGETRLVETGLQELLDRIENDGKIRLWTRTRVESVEGEPGNYTVSLQNPEGKRTTEAGSIIHAMGWQPYPAGKLADLGYGRSPDVITGIELEEMAREGELRRPSDGKTLNKVLFIQCAGSRDPDHLPYCSNHCCATTLKQTRYLREAGEDIQVYILYKDIRTPGLDESFYSSVQRDPLVFMTKGAIRRIQPLEHIIRMELYAALLEEEISLDVDLVVLATGMTPAPAEAMNLTYRKGTGLPTLKYEFPDSHFICFPYETQRTGIYAAGTARAPMDIASCREDATGAVMKAIQCIESVRVGKSLHPRSGDLGYPVINFQRCTDCKRCTEECPFGAYDETPEGTPVPYPARCRRCGICMGSCPERVINFKDYSIHSISSMIKAIEVPDEFEEKPRILVFACENDAYPAFDMAAKKGLKFPNWFRIIPVRCIGSVNRIWLSDALSHGYDGIMLFGCKPGEDYQCHYIQGSELIKTRGDNIRETLDSMMLEAERIRVEFVEITDYCRIPEILEEYAETIESIGPNPFKGM